MTTAIIKLLLIISPFIFFHCSSLQEEPAASELNKEDLPDQESWQSSIFITKEGRRVAIINAGYIASYQKKQVTVLSDSIHVDFYDNDGNHNSILTADEGIVYNQTNNLTATGNVYVVSDSGIVLQTKELKWDNKKQKIVSEIPVIFTTDTDTLLGDSFISDPNLKNYELRNARGYSRRVIKLEK
jgi:LPS export ABC transporter protein LptC